MWTNGSWYCATHNVETTTYVESKVFNICASYKIKAIIFFRQSSCVIFGIDGRKFDRQFYNERLLLGTLKGPINFVQNKNGWLN